MHFETMISIPAAVIVSGDTCFRILTTMGRFAGRSAHSAAARNLQTATPPLTGSRGSFSET